MRIEELMAMKRVVEEKNLWRHRPENRYMEDGKALVSIVSANDRDLKTAVRNSVDLIGGVRKSLNPQDKVLLKANYNSDDPFPASTDPTFLTAVVEVLREEGIDDLTLGERSGWPWMPTAKVMKEMGVFETARSLDLKVLDFDSGPWMDVEMDGRAKWWKHAAYHSSLKEFDKIVFLPCCKHHFLARFTMSLKLVVGLTHPLDMMYLHADYRFGKKEEPMEEKVVELCLPVGPDLIIVDSRKSFVTDGPASGEIVEPNLILASGDRIAIDVEGVKILQSYPRLNRLQMPVWELPIIKGAVEFGLGASDEASYKVVTG